MRHQPPLVPTMAPVHPRGHRRSWAGVVVLAALSFVPRAAAGQVGGSIAGYVTDPSDRVVVGAVVEARAGDAGTVRRSATDGTGFFRLIDLPPRSYEITASAPGFDVAAATVTVHVDADLRVDLRLVIAAVHQEVAVLGSPRDVGTTEAGLGLVVDRERIAALPMNRRDFLQLSLLGTGVAPPVEGSELSTRGAFAMHVNGGREEYNNYLLDGVDNNDPYVNRYVVQPAVDSIGEFRVATNGYSAEYGRNAAGQVNVVTRSGADRLSGFAYEYARDEALDARNYFASGTPPYHRDQAGMGAGGPVVRGRLFFFGAADLLRERQGFTRLGTVPTDAERRGDLSGLAQTIVDPFTRQPFAGNLIPASRISPVALRMLQSFPRANREGAVNFAGESTRREEQGQGYVRLDGTVGPRDSLTLRYSQGRVRAYEPYTETASALPGFGDEVADDAINATVQHQRVIGDRATHALRVGFNRITRDLVQENQDVDVGSAWGVSWLGVASRALGYPMVNVAGYSPFGDTVALPILRDTRTLHVVEQVAMDRGRHLLRAGGELRQTRSDGTLDVLARGSLSFSGAISGSGISDLLLGLPSFGLQSKADNPVHLRSTAMGLYVQDSWRIRAGLTLDAGLRYELASPPEDPDDHMATLVTSTGQVVPLASVADVDRVATDGNNVAPRVGVVWAPGGSTVVRAAYGLFYDAGMFTVYSTPYFNPPYFTLRVFFPTATSLLTLDDPFPTTGGLAPPPSLNVLSPDLVTSYMQHWNVAVEHEAGPLGVLRVAYAGSNGRHLVQARDLNQPPPGSGALQARRPYPQFGNIFYVQSSGASEYDSLQASLDRPLRGGWSLLASYTLAKSMDGNSAFLDTTPDRNLPQNSSDLDAEWGPSSFDVRHRAVFAASWRLPAGNALTRDTQLRAIGTFQSGTPLTPVLRFDNSNTGNTGGTAGSDRPNVSGPTGLSDPTPERWFDTSAFQVAPRYSFGNSGRNAVRGPGYASLDVAVSRTIAIRAGVRLLLDVQAFNVLNHTNFDLPQLFADEPVGFGRILSAKPPRQIQLAARVEF